MQVTGVLANLQVWERSETTNGGLSMAISLLAELRPQTLLESLLAVQMVGVFQAGTKLLASGLAGEQSLEQAEWRMRSATRLMRLYTEQVEAMVKLRGKSTEQKVIVEHVHVYQGGQAIVGAVQPPRSGRRGMGAGDGVEK